MMLSRNMKTLIEKMHAKTREKKLEWNRASWGDAFETRVAGRTVTLSRGTDDPSQPRPDQCFLVRVLDQEGRQLTSVTLSPDIHGSHERYYRMASQMFFEAGQISSGAEEALEEMIEALDLI